MHLIIKNHSYIYNVQTVTQIFLQNETFLNSSEVCEEGYTLLSQIVGDSFETELYLDGVKVISDKKKIIDTESHEAKVSVFLLLSRYFEYVPQYGVLTGIRPTKLVQKLFSENKINSEITEILRKRYFVSDEKIDFLLKVAISENKIIKEIDVTKNAVYIGIPFCPSKCAYCSFTSFDMKKYKDNGVMKKYVDYLINEITYVTEHCKNQIENLYIGGGTPTSLDDENFERLFKSISENFDISKLKEFTVEAGRVDTITKSNLLIMKKYGVNRISINAQSMNDETLRLNGRTHTKQEFKEKFLLARELGFEYINVDLIVGLLGESKRDILESLRQVLEFDPENITIHTLAIKKGSTYKQRLDEYDFLDIKILKETLDSMYGVLYKNEYIPYYMYRQKNLLGNFENTGFSKQGFESIYNVSIILEAQNIIGLGAGADSKLVSNGEVKRSYNLKGVEEYIEKFDTILDRKKIFF